MWILIMKQPFLLVNSIIQVHYILTNFLFIFSNNYWELGIDISDCICVLVYYSRQFYWFGSCILKLFLSIQIFRTMSSQLIDPFIIIKFLFLIIWWFSLSWYLLYLIIIYSYSHFVLSNVCMVSFPFFYFYPICVFLFQMDFFFPVNIFLYSYLLIINMTTNLVSTIKKFLLKCNVHIKLISGILHNDWIFVYVMSDHHK